MIISNEKGNFLKLPYVVGEEVYISTTIDWSLGIVKGVISDIEIWWNKKVKDFYCRVYVEHPYIRSDKNPNMIVNRYVFFEGEIAKTYEEAYQKIQDKELRKKNYTDVNTL